MSKWYTVKRVFGFGAPLAGIVGLTYFIYKRGQADGMNDLCDWVKNHGHVEVTGDDEDFTIKKEELSTEEGA